MQSNFQPLAVADASYEPRPSLEEARAATEEVSLIRSRHSHVHNIHGILCCYVGYEALLQQGIWSRRLQLSYDAQLARARMIDRTGMDTQCPFAAAV